MPFTLVSNMYERIHTNVNCMNILQIISPDTTRSFKYYPPKPAKENHLSFQNISHSLYPFFFAIMIDVSCLKILSLRIQDLLNILLILT